MTREANELSRRAFVRVGAAAWGITALGPYTNSMAESPGLGISVPGFRSPPLSARPMVLWPWLNGHVDRLQITRELEEMRAKGLRGPIIWDVGSIADPEKTIPVGPPFLGDESVATIHHAIDEAERLGLDVGLFASSSWNAGGAWIQPEHASKQLLWAERMVSGPASFSDLPPVPDGLEAPFFDVALLAVPHADSDAGPGGRPVEPVNLASEVNESGQLSWEIPPGDWTVLRFVCSGTGQALECPSPASDGLVVDHMSAAATDRHFDVILDRLFGDGKELRALKLMMLDSFEVWERPDWTPGFESEFRQAFGYDPLPYLPILAGRGTHPPELGERFLHDYRVLVSRLMITNHFARTAAILDRRGLSLLAEAGHGGFPRVDSLEALGVSHIPMGEFWNGRQFWVTKEAASAAHIYGRQDVAAEALTGWRHWHDGPAEYKRLFDIAFCAGLNRPVFHTFAHNPPEAGKPGFAYHAGEHFNVNSTWWEQAGPMLLYLSRCSHLLRQGRFVADVCFYYGDQAPNLVPARRIDPKVAPPHDEGECQHCGRPMPNRVESLGAGYDYDYVNRDIVVRDMQVRNGRLVLSSGMEYRLIVLADRGDIALPVLRKLEQLVRDGATLVGRAPHRANSLEGYPRCDEEVRRLSRLLWGEGDTEGAHRHGKGQVFPEVVLRDVLSGMGLRPDFAVEASAEHELDYIHRRTESEELYFVANGADEPVEAECSFRVAEGSKPFLWNPEDGSVTPCPTYRLEAGAVRVPLKLPQVSSMFVVFRTGQGGDHVVDLGRKDHAAPSLLDRDLEVLALTPTHARIRAQRAGTFKLTTASGRSATVEVADPLGDIMPAGPWMLEFPEGHGAPASVELDELRSWADLESEAARAFAGTARYTTTMQVPAANLDGSHALHLDLGEVAEIAEVSVNGTPIDVLWSPPFRADVTGLLKAGANRLEVQVTNLWHNRIVGDLRSPEAVAHAPTNLKHKFSADMDLLPSGLLGPVVLRSCTEVDIAIR
ncbi:MAG TPA: glycosyl hydrolase [Acidobacteriota bacterium]|nr:glycosyl hydrolase [Acidobacteriota bacterium]